MEVCQFSKMVKTRFWQPWEANFWPWRCVNSQKWRFRGTGAFGRPIFGQGGVPIHQNGDFKVLSLLVGQFLARVLFNFAKMAISRHWHPWLAKFWPWQCCNSPKMAIS